MLPTPSTSHVSFDRVYEPAEDSFLMIDTLSSASEKQFLQRRLHGTVPLVLEIGSGSGVIIAFVTAHSKSLFSRRDICTLAVDINPYACNETISTVVSAQATSRHNEGVFLGAVQSDLDSSLRDNSVDVLIFNPPYVPTEETPANLIDCLRRFDSLHDCTRGSRLLALSYAGGEDGMETTNKLLDSLPRILAPKTGVAYILFCARNHPDEVMQRIKSWGSNWDACVASISGKKGGWEKLSILRIWRCE